MKRWLLALCIVVMGMLPIASHAAVSKIYGGAVDATGFVPAVISASLLCSTGCPLNTAPDLVVSTRFWGIDLGVNCRVSNDAGITWGACPTNPFAGLAGIQRHIAGAADGSTIVMTQSGATCTVKRSVDGGVTWPTVFTVASLGCGGTAGSGDTRLKCVSTGVCVFIGADTGTAVAVMLRSIDSGLNWVFSSTVDTISSNPTKQFSFDGTNGALFVGGFLGKTYLVNGVTVALSAGWSPTGFTSCSGSYIIGGSRIGLCEESPFPYTAYTTTGSFVTNITLPGALDVATTGALAYALGSNTVYVWTSTSTGYAIWYSTNSGASFVQIFNSVLTQMTPDGTVFSSGGCIYYSLGGPVVFGKIC